MNWTEEEQGWSNPGFGGSSDWSAAVSRPFPARTPAQQMPLATVVSRHKPVSARQYASNETHGSWLYDFGRNLVGTVELAPLPRALDGSAVTLVHGEWLEVWSNQSKQRCPEPATCEGNIVPAVSGGHQAVFHTLRANNAQPLAPIFAWHGFQYVTVVASHTSSFAGGLRALEALEIHTNVSSTGSLSFGGDGIPGSESEMAAEVMQGVQGMLLASQLSNLAACKCSQLPLRRLLEASKQSGCRYTHVLSDHGEARLDGW